MQWGGSDAGAWVYKLQVIRYGLKFSIATVKYKMTLVLLGVRRVWGLAW